MKLEALSAAPILAAPRGLPAAAFAPGRWGKAERRCKGRGRPALPHDAPRGRGERGGTEAAQ